MNGGEQAELCVPQPAQRQFLQINCDEICGFTGRTSHLQLEVDEWVMVLHGFVDAVKPLVTRHFSVCNNVFVVVDQQRANHRPPRCLAIRESALEPRELITSCRSS